MKETYITAKEAAKILGVSKVTIYNFLKQGLFRGKRFGKQIRIDLKSFNEFIDAANV